MLQGFYWEQVQAASAAFKDAPHAMARIAGNAIPMETNMVCCTVDTSLMEYCGSTHSPDRGTHCPTYPILPYPTLSYPIQDRVPLSYPTLPYPTLSRIS